MEHRTLISADRSRTSSPGRSVSAVGLGTWQLGADWGEVSESEARQVLEAAYGAGVRFLDTADVYGDGRSEQVIGGFLASLGGADHGITVATKMGRRAEQVPQSYTLEHFREWTDRSRRLLGVETLDLVQLHCPPSATVRDEATYDALDQLVQDGAIAAYGVSVETAEQALAAIARPGTASIQIILNAFRLKPLEEVLPAAREAGVGVVARVPLASGLLAGRYDESTTFAEDDHRTFNRDGSAFDVGETFSGVGWETGLAAAREFTALVREHGPAGATAAQTAIAWVAQQEGVSTVIPGARSARQARDNAAAGDLPPLSQSLLAGVHDIYDRHLRGTLHERW